MTSADRSMATIGALRLAIRLDGERGPARRRAGSALFWRQLPGPGTAALRPVIRPAWHWHLNLALTQQPLAGALVEAARPGGAVSAIGAPGVLPGRPPSALAWRTDRRDPAGPPVSGAALATRLDKLLAAAPVPARKGSAPAAASARSGVTPVQTAAERSWFERPSPAAQAGPIARSIFVSPQLAWRIPATSVGTGGRSSGFGAQPRPGPRLPRSARALRAPAPVSAQTLRTITAWLAPAGPARRSRTAPAALVLTPAARSHAALALSASPPAPRRAAPELVWSRPAGQPQAASDFAALRSASSVPHFAPTPASPASVTPAPWPAQGAAASLPDAGRLVDEVIQRIDRRMRDERFRRGM